MLRYYLVYLKDSLPFTCYVSVTSKWKFVHFSVLPTFRILFCQKLRYCLPQFQHFLRLDYYISTLHTFRLLFSSIIMMVSCALFRFSFLRLHTLVSWTLLGFSFSDCCVSTSRALRKAFSFY